MLCFDVLFSVMVKLCISEVMKKKEYEKRSEDGRRHLIGRGYLYGKVQYQFFIDMTLIILATSIFCHHYILKFFMFTGARDYGYVSQLMFLHSFGKYGLIISCLRPKAVVGRL